MAISWDRRGPPKIVALNAVAAFRRKERQLFSGFDALGYDRDFEAAAEANNSANDRRRLRVAAKVHDEGPVDLDLVEGERLHIGQ